MPYSREIADQVLAEMAEGKSLKEICRTHREAGEDWPAPATFRLWVVNDTDGLADRYARAREAQGMHWADEILEAADDATNDWVERVNRRGETERAVDREHIQRSALRVDARKWLLAKLHPQLYGERVAHQALGKDGKPTEPPVFVLKVEG